MSNLWERVEISEKDKSPYSILLEQSEHFNKMYSGILTSDVRAARSKLIDAPFVYRMDISALRLSYVVTILTVRFPVEFYPLHVTSYDDAIPTGLRSSTSIDTIAQTEAHYIQILSTIFNSQKIKKVIRALVLQAKEDSASSIFEDSDNDLPF